MGDDGIDDRAWLVMFPKSENRPSALAQEFVGTSISFAVAGDLRFPPLSIGLGLRPMDWTSMPETSVEEDHYPLTGPNDVTAEMMVW